MGKLKKKQANKFAAMKRMISLSDQRIKEKDRFKKPRKEKPDELKVREVAQYSSALYFKYNEQLGPPYRVLMDTNFINFSVLHKLDIVQAMMDCLYAKCIPYITDCVMGELESAINPRLRNMKAADRGKWAHMSHERKLDKTIYASEANMYLILARLGTKYRVALRIARDPRFERLTCSHKGIYADDCLIKRITEHKCYIVGTCDKDLKRRIRKIPGVPIMYIVDKRYTIERMPDAYGAPKNK